MRLQRPILLTLLIVFLGVASCFGYFMTQDFLGHHYLCRLHQVAQGNQQSIFEKSKKYESDLFLKKYFIEPQHIKTFARIKDFMQPFRFVCTSDAQRVPEDPKGFRNQMAAFLSWFFPKYQKDFLTQVHGLEYIAVQNDKMEAELIEQKQQIHEKMASDLGKYYFFMKQVRMTQKMLAQFSSSCRTPAAMNTKKYECQRSIKKLSDALSKEEENLKFNYTILVEKWSAYKDWIDQEISLFEKQNLEEIEA